MKFSAIVPHLSKQGFVTRKLWRGKAVMFFGMDNSAMRSLNPERGEKKELLTKYWSPNLQEIGASDWIILPYYWNGSKDDFKPFDERSIVLIHLQETERKKEKKKEHDESVCHSLKKT